jgi:hypothetical protein
MKLAYVKLSSIGFLAMAIAAAVSMAQYVPAPVSPGIEIRDVNQRMMRPPDYGAGSNLGNTVPALNQNWLRLETQFETQAEWVDEVKVKFFVSVGEGRETRVFVGELTPVNLARGTHYAAMFMHPSVLDRFGRGRVNAVAVQIFSKDKLVDQRCDRGAEERWWERTTTTPGALITPKDSPWAPIASGRYEAIKAQ